MYVVTLHVCTNSRTVESVCCYMVYVSVITAGLLKCEVRIALSGRHLCFSSDNDKIYLIQSYVKSF